MTSRTMVCTAAMYTTKMEGQQEEEEGKTNEAAEAVAAVCSIPIRIRLGLRMAIGLIVDLVVHLAAGQEDTMTAFIGTSSIPGWRLKRRGVSMRTEMVVPTVEV